MTQITEKFQQVLYTGPALDLATAPFMGNIRQIGRRNALGTGFVTWKPGAVFPGFSMLESGEIYTIYSLTIPYTIPTDDAEVEGQGPTYANEFFDPIPTL